MYNYVRSLFNIYISIYLLLTTHSLSLSPSPTVNLSEYARFKGFKCPVVFAISDNQICISLKNKGWINEFLDSRLGVPIFKADGAMISWSSRLADS